MSLEVSLRHRQGAFALDLAFDSPGGLVALFGPSGSGKTTVVRAIAGLLRAEQARIVVDGQVLVDSAARVFLPPHRRRIGYVFQEPRLLPHLSVRQNLDYGGWFAPRGARVSAAEFARLVELLDIGPLLSRHPGRLSGGERQRVAIGRALLSSPQLLLMDEPLSQIDENRKSEILPYIERMRDEVKVPIVYVSHALDEVVRLAGRLVCIQDGRLLASGPIGEVLTRTDLPMFAQRADAGAVLEARVLAHDEAYALSRLACAGGELWVPRLPTPPGGTVRLWVRAQDVMLALELPQGISALNHLQGEVLALGDSGLGTVMVRLDCGGTPLLARVTRLSAERLRLRVGLRLQALIKSVSFPLAGAAAGAL